MAIQALIVLRRCGVIDKGRRDFMPIPQSGVFYISICGRFLPGLVWELSLFGSILPVKSRLLSGFFCE